MIDVSGARGWGPALAGWTVFLWTNRVRNLVVDDGLSTFGFAWRMAIAVWFLTAAALVVGGLMLGRSRPVHRLAAAWAVRVLAVVGSLWWLVRGTQTLLGDGEVSFKIVHTVLALVTISLSVMALRALGFGPLWVNQSVSSRSHRPTTE